jgi:hypothetical protein
MLPANYIFQTRQITAARMQLWPMDPRVCIYMIRVDSMHGVWKRTAHALVIRRLFLRSNSGAAKSHGNERLLVSLSVTVLNSKN